MIRIHVPKKRPRASKNNLEPLRSFGVSYMSPSDIPMYPLRMTLESSGYSLYRWIVPWGTTLCYRKETDRVYFLPETPLVSYTWNALRSLIKDGWEPVTDSEKAFYQTFIVGKKP